MKNFLQKMILFLQKIKQKVFSKYFWKRNWRIFLIIISLFAVVALFFTVLISGQNDVGAKEAGVELSQLAQNIRRQYKVRPDFWGLSTPEVIHKKLYPLSMKVENDHLQGYFGMPVMVGSDENGTAVMPTGKLFAVSYHNLTQAQCIGLGGYKFSQDFWFGLKKISLITPKDSYVFEWGNKDFRLPVSRADLKNLCRKQNNALVFYFE